MTGAEAIVHGTCVARRGRAVVICGASGAGKSDLALRYLYLPRHEDGGPRLLVADDRVCLSAGPDGVTARAPETIAGLLEVRGIGLVRVAHTSQARVVLWVDLVEAGTRLERMPLQAGREIFGASVPLVRLDPREPAAAMKLDLALEGTIEAGIRGV